MTNFECDKIFDKILDDIFKKDIDENIVIEKLNTELSIDQKLILLSYYLKYKFYNKPKEEVKYNNTDSLPDILSNIIKFVVNDIEDTVEENDVHFNFELSKVLVSEAFKLFNDNKKLKNDKAIITMDKTQYIILKEMMNLFVKQNGLFDEDKDDKI